MQSICIGISDCDKNMTNYLANEFKKLHNLKINLITQNLNTMEPFSIVCSIDENQPPKKNSSSFNNELLTDISNILAEYIIKNYEPKFIEKIINNNYYYYNMFEKKEILGFTMNIINNSTIDKYPTDNFTTLAKKNLIISKLLDYFENSDYIIIDGFVNFRLKEYIKTLEDITDKAVNDFIVEKEYREFIRLLKYFVEIQDSKCNTVHIIVGSGKYTLLDENKINITNECVKEFVSDILGEDLNFDDLLVSSLITLAPKKIIVHNHMMFQNKEILETIKNVFLEKVLLCNDCEICAENSIQNKN